MSGGRRRWFRRGTARPVVDLYFSCWNNVDILPFLFRHYDGLVRRYVAYDDGSDDGSRALLEAHPRLEIRAMPVPGAEDSRTLVSGDLTETSWRVTSADADWVILVDVDEHLVHPDLLGYLARCAHRGITIVPALGYQMLGTRLPDGGRLADQLTTGAPWVQMNKLGAFAPQAIDELRMAPGRHSAAPTGRIVAPDHDELLLLHYKYVDFERVVRRNERAGARLHDADRAQGYGHRWAFDRDALRADWEQFAAQAVDVAAPGFAAGATHPAPRWWEGYRLGAARRPERS